MTAEQMFNDLNYKVEKNKTNENIITIKLDDEKWIYYINFDLKRKEIDFEMNEYIDMKMLKAINKLCEELGWL